MHLCLLRALVMLRRWLRKDRRGTRPVGWVPAVLLTLSTVNIYPTLAQEGGSGVPGIGIDALFDFEVPVTVISNGVLDAFETEPQGWFDPDYVYTNLVGDFDASVSNSSLLFDFGGGYRAPVESVMYSYSSNVVELASTNASASLVGSGVASGIAGTFNSASLQGIAVMVQQDTPSALSLGVSDPLAGTSPGAGFWVQTLTPAAIKAIDGGRLAERISAIDRDGFLGWLARGYEPGLQTWCDFVNQSWLQAVVRGASKLVCVLLFWLLAYRFVLTKIFLIIDSALNTVRHSKQGA